MKFKLIPTEIIELLSYRNTKDKTKAFWIWQTWGYINWKEFHTNDFSFSEDCETIEEIQSKLDEVLKKAVPISKDKKHTMYDDYEDEDDLYDIKQIADVLNMEEDDFINDDSGGFATNQVFKWENVTEQEKEKVSSIPDDEDENKKVTLSDAAEGNMNEWLNDLGYESDDGVTLYRLPLKVVSTEEKPKTEKTKTTEESKFGKRVFLKIEKFLFNSKISKRYQIYNEIFYVTLNKKSDYKKLHKGIRAEFKKLTKLKGSVNIFAVGKKRDKNIDEEHQYGFKFVDKKDEE
jgi:hypothetical protein